MPTAPVNGREICYESFGADDAPALLLIQGLGAQLTLWPPGLVAELIGRGFRVIRFDNRDCGLSTKTDGPLPDIIDLMARHEAGEPLDAPYTLSDMAADTVALLDHLGIDAAHVVGASLGGMIAQTIAIEHPDRLLSLTSIMSTAGDLETGQPRPEALVVLLAPPPSGREEVIAATVRASEFLSGPLFDAARSRETATESYDRSFHPQGALFQIAAAGASGDRSAALGTVTAPTLVIHGAEDPLFTVSAAETTAKAVPGADLLVLDDMGHDLPRNYWPQMADAIAAVAAKG